MPGEGLSAKPRYRGRDHRRFLVAYLVELLDALGLDRPDVVGHSFGGAQAFLLAIDHDRVNRLCLLGAPVGLSRRYPVSIRLLSIRGLNRLLLALLNSGDPVANARQWIGRFVVDDSAIPERFYELYALRNELPGRQESVRSLMSELTTFGIVRQMLEFRSEIIDIERPICFVWGTEDYYWGPTLGRSVASEMSNGAFHELAEHGHTVWLEPGNAAETRVLSFLDR